MIHLKLCRTFKAPGRITYCEDQMRYKNIALFPEDREKLKEMADFSQRSMTRQMSVILKKEYKRFTEKTDSDKLEA